MTEEEKKEAELLVPKERRDYPRVAVSVKVMYRVLSDDDADAALTKNFDAEKIFKETSGKIYWGRVYG